MGKLTTDVHKTIKMWNKLLLNSTVMSITKGSLLYGSSTFVSAVACSCGVWHESSYSSGLFSRSGRDPVGERGSASAFCRFRIATFKVAHFFLRYWVMPVTSANRKARMPKNVASAMETEVYPTASWFPPELLTKKVAAAKMIKFKANEPSRASRHQFL